MKKMSRRGLLGALRPNQEFWSISNGEPEESPIDHEPVPASFGAEKISRRDLFGILRPGHRRTPFFDEQYERLDEHDQSLFPTGSTRETVETCDYCQPGCSFIVTTREGRIVSIDPNPDEAPREEQRDCPRREDWAARLMKTVTNPS